MNARLYSALREVDMYNRGHMRFCWRLKSMQTLADMMLVQNKSSRAGTYDWHITPAGRAKLAEMEEKNE